jgi:hypothetical protein
MANITYEWTLPVASRLYLGQELGYGLSWFAPSFRNHWTFRLAANLAMASLLTRAGDAGYGEGMDEAFEACGQIACERERLH